jgi:DNA-binding IclR family transcriptional regulator
MTATLHPAGAAGDETLARLSFAFLRDEVTGGMAGLEPLDALVVLAINQANIIPLTRDPDARARYGQLDAPARDDERRPVSINAVAGSLGLPFETARRRIRRLTETGVCLASRDGLVVPAAFLTSPAYLQSVLAAHDRMRRFYLDLKAAGFADGLPPPAYSLEGSIPVRAAARLLSDYILRTSEGLMREAGNVVSVLVFVALLDVALRRRAGDPAAQAPQTLTSLAAALGLAPETVRRHVAQLADLGQCVRSSAGVILAPEALERPGLRQLFADNAIHVHRLLAGLAERSVILAWETGGALDGREIA